MPDYTLGPTETHIREAHLYAQIPSLLSITGTPGATLRNDGPTTITVSDGVSTTLHALPAGGTTHLDGSHYTIAATGAIPPGFAPWQAFGRFTITRD